MFLPGLIGSAMYGELKSFGGGDDSCDDRAMAKAEGIISRLDLGGDERADRGHGRGQNEKW